MNDFNEEPALVIRSLIPEEERMNHTAQLFGVHLPLLIEPVVYTTARRLAEGYDDGFYMV